MAQVCIFYSRSQAPAGERPFATQLCLGASTSFALPSTSSRPVFCSSGRLSPWPSCSACANSLSASPTRTYGSAIYPVCSPLVLAHQAAVFHRALGRGRGPGTRARATTIRAAIHNLFTIPSSLPNTAIPPGLPALLQKNEKTKKRKRGKL